MDAWNGVLGNSLDDNECECFEDCECEDECECECSCECDHKWKYLGSNRHGSYYLCTKCGLEEEG